MLRSERIILIVLAAGAAALLLMAQANSRRVRLPLPPQAVVITASPESVISPNAAFKGEAASPFTLIEFADYGCHFCRSADGMVSALLVQNRGKLRYQFRNLPIARLSADASPALAAEAAGMQGQFWPMHDRLLRAPLPFNAADLAAEERALHLDATRFARDRAAPAQAIVKEDARQAAKLRVQGTPTFFLCCPDHHVIRLGALEQVNDYLATNQSAKSQGTTP